MLFLTQIPVSGFNLSLSGGKPLRFRARHVVSLAFVGHRPRKPNKAKFSFSVQEVACNGNLVNWLKSFGLRVDFFVNAVSSESWSKPLLPGRLEPRPQLEPLPGESFAREQKAATYDAKAAILSVFILLEGFPFRSPKSLKVGEIISSRIGRFLKQKRNL